MDCAKNPSAFWRFDTHTAPFKLQPSPEDARTLPLNSRVQFDAGYPAAFLDRTKSRRTPPFVLEGFTVLSADYIRTHRVFCGVACVNHARRNRGNVGAGLGAGSRAVRWDTVSTLVADWVITLPASAAVSAAVWWLDAQM